MSCKTTIMSLEDVLERLEFISEKVDSLTTYVTNLKKKERGVTHDALGAGALMSRGPAVSEHGSPVIGPRRGLGEIEIRRSLRTSLYLSTSRTRRMVLMQATKNVVHAEHVQ